jgi:hypothetical protein
MEAEVADDVVKAFSDGFRAGQFSTLHDVYRLLDSGRAESASDVALVLHSITEALLTRRRAVLEKGFACKLTKRHGPNA